MAVVLMGGEWEGGGGRGEGAEEVKELARGARGGGLSRSSSGWRFWG